MSFNILSIPFYKAVDLFEHESYQAAYDEFFKLSKQGNVYAIFYLDYLAKNRDLLRVTVLKEQDEFIQSLDCSLMPTVNNVKHWCTASTLIIQYNQTKEDREKSIILEKIRACVVHASNAAVFILRLPEQTSEQCDRAQSALVKHCNFYTLYHLKHLNESILTPQMHQEWALMNKSSALAQTGGGNLERLFSRYYDGPTAKTSSSPFTQDLVRKLQWQYTSILMGNRELITLFFTARSFNFDERKRWIMLAACCGIVQAETLTIGLEYHEKGDHQTARMILERAVKKVDPGLNTLRGEAYTTLGLIYEGGLGDIIKNEKIALEYYQQADACGDNCLNVGIFHEQGRGGLEKNCQLAIEKYLESSRRICKDDPKNAAIAHLYVAEIYKDGGPGVERNLKLSAEQYKIAAGLGNVTALREYAICLEQGEGVSLDKAQACAMFNKAAELGDIFSGFIMALKCIGGAIKKPEESGLTQKKIHKYLNQALANKDLIRVNYANAECESLMGVFYSDYCGTPDLTKAYHYFKLGEKENQKTSLMKLGSFYEHSCSSLSIEPNLKKAFEYFQRAADLGVPEGLNNTAAFMVKGLAGEKDYGEIKKRFEEALAGGCKIAAYGLSGLYRHGHGVPPDLKRAFEYLEIAEETGDLDVLNILGIHHYHGKGTPENTERALCYYQRAFEAGSPAGGHNYMMIKLWQAYHHNQISESLLKDLLEKSTLGVKAGYASSLCYSAMIRLWIDPRQVQAVVEELRKATSEKPYKRSQAIIDYLSSRTQVSNLELLILCFSADPIAELKKHSEMLKLTISTMEASSASAKKPAVSGSKSSTAVVLKRAPTKTISDTAVARIRQEVEWFTTPAHLKQIDFSAFKQLLGKIASCEEGMEIIMTHSKGSNQQFSITAASLEKRAALSYHPLADEEFDPKRARSLQAFVRHVASGIPALARTGSELSVTEHSKTEGSPVVNNTTSSSSRSLDNKTMGRI